MVEGYYGDHGGTGWVLKEELSWSGCITEDSMLVEKVAGHE